MIYLLAAVIPFASVIMIVIIKNAIVEQVEKRRIKKEMSDSLECFDRFCAYQRSLIEQWILLTVAQQEDNRQ